LNRLKRVITVSVYSKSGALGISNKQLKILIGHVAEFEEIDKPGTPCALLVESSKIAETASERARFEV
jgi:hypothetical protein